MRKLYVILFTLFSFLVLASPALAADQVDLLDPVCADFYAKLERNEIDEDELPAVCADSQGTDNPLYGPNGVLTKALSIFALVVGVVAVFVIIIGGLKFITSRGDPGSVATARNTIIYATVGIMVAAISQSVVLFILKKIR